MLNNYSVAIVGVTGYSGRELDRLLSGHPRIRVTGRFASKEDRASGAAAFSLDALVASGPDIVVLATDHELSVEVTPGLLGRGYRVLDMSGGFRLKDAEQYPAWYGFTHAHPHLLSEAVYGLGEFPPPGIEAARLVANPGCYATSAILPLLPLFRAGAVDSSQCVVIDGKSGVSGAGKKPSARTHFCEVTENISAYGVLRHRHTPEIVQALPGATPESVVFTPHLIPIDRGILTTIVLKRTPGADIRGILESAYRDSPSVRVLPDGEMPAVRDVARTNFCWIGVAVDGNRVVLVSAIDNLVKGAAGQALENLNLMLGCERQLGWAA